MMNLSGVKRRIDDLGRIIIPKDIREMLALEEGQQMEIVVVDGMILMGKANESEI